MLTFNGAAKSITVSETSTISVRDLWSRYVDWFLTDDNSKYGVWFLSIGGNPIDEAEGTYVPVYLFKENDVSILSSDSSATVTVKDGIILNTDGGDPFSDYVGKIRYSQPVQAISFAAGESTGLTTQSIADEVMSRGVATVEDVARFGAE
jgi:hypothetical protein